MLHYVLNRITDCLPRVTKEKKKPSYGTVQPAHLSCPYSSFQSSRFMFQLINGVTTSNAAGSSPLWTAFVRFLMPSTSRSLSFSLHHIKVSQHCMPARAFSSYFLDDGSRIGKVGDNIGREPLVLSESRSSPLKWNWTKWMLMSPQHRLHFPWSSRCLMDFTTSLDFRGEPFSHPPWIFKDEFILLWKAP